MGGLTQRNQLGLGGLSTFEDVLNLHQVIRPVLDPTDMADTAASLEEHQRRVSSKTKLRL